MIILIDRREKAGYTFDRYTVELATLPIGDYAIKGFEHRIAIERKSASDLFACLTATRERKRFEAELFKARGLEYFALIVESTFSGLADGNGNRSRTSKVVALQTLMRLSVQHNLSVFFAENRVYGLWFVQCLLEKYWKELSRIAEAVSGASSKLGKKD